MIFFQFYQPPYGMYCKLSKPSNSSKAICILVNTIISRDSWSESYGEGKGEVSIGLAKLKQRIAIQAVRYRESYQSVIQLRVRTPNNV